MKVTSLCKPTSYAGAWCAALLLIAQAVAAEETVRVLVGELTLVTRTHVTIGGIRTLRIDRNKSKCFDFRGELTTCDTLAQVGYVDKARVAYVGDVVQRIDIIELQQ